MTAGDVKVMDLIYCPFSKSCAECDRRELYTLTDENGRAFPMRRCSVGVDPAAEWARLSGGARAHYGNYTKGHSENGVL